MPTVKHGGGSVVVSGGWMTCCNCRNHELCSLLENPKAKCPAIIFSLKLKEPWVLQLENDLKHISKSTSE